MLSGLKKNFFTQISETAKEELNKIHVGPEACVGKRHIKKSGSEEGWTLFWTLPRLMAMASAAQHEGKAHCTLFVYQSLHIPKRAALLPALREWDSKRGRNSICIEYCDN